MNDARKTALNSIAPERRRGWTVRVNDSVLEGVSLLALEHDELGTLIYGETPSGYDSWVFQHKNGGVVTLPFSVIDGAIHVGLVHERRFNQGGEVWNAPRGYLKAGESPEAGGRREFSEETGYHSAADALVRLPGQRGNPNSAFFDTRAEEQGIAFFALEVSPEVLQPGDDGYAFREGHLDMSEAALTRRAEEWIGRIRFHPWVRAACVGDMFTNAAVARLLAWLRSSGRSL